MLKGEVIKQENYHKWFLFLAGIAVLLLLIRLGAAPVYILDEAKNAQCAREMWLRGDWIVPTFNGELRTDKPALHYWFMRTAYALGGANPFSARFFSAVAGFFLILITYFQTKKSSSAGVAFFAAVSLVLSTHFIFEFRLSVPDPYLILFTAIGLFAGFNYLEYRKSSQILLAGISLGLAALSKGPVAYALPGIIFLIYIFITKKWDVFREPILWISGIIAIAVAVPWYYAVHKQTNGAFTSGFFLDHNLNRFSSEKEGHGGPFFITILIVIIGMLPVSFPVIAGFQKRFRFFNNPLYLFSAIVAGVYILFFSVSSTKLPNYPMPCYPFIAVLAGFMLKEIFEKRYDIPGLIWLLWIIISLAIPAGGYFALKNEPDVAEVSYLALLLLVLPLGVCLGWLQRERHVLSITLIGFAWLFFSMIVLWVAYPTLYQINPVSKLGPLIQNEDRVFAYKAFNPAFNFNSSENKMIIPMARSSEELDSIVSNINMNSSTGAQDGNMILITRKEYADELKAKGFAELGRHKDLFELPTTVIMKK
ncbi:MAG: glycosyltransferase family 39 protein [Chitinophagaceae bacterium]|nr:glycosyltransferase family 39 protein [Chitinophagaceae bacterium]